MIGADVVFDFMGKQNYSPVNFVVHPEVRLLDLTSIRVLTALQHWAVIAFTGQDEDGLASNGSQNPLYRLAFVEPPDLPSKPEDYMIRTNERLKLWIKDKQDFKVLRSEPYINSQRCASSDIQGTRPSLRATPCM